MKKGVTGGARDVERGEGPHAQEGQGCRKYRIGQKYRKG